MVEYRENCLQAADLVAFREAQGWVVPTLQQAQKAINGSHKTLCAFVNGTLAGMGRLVGDGAMIWYFQDIIVKETYQGRGIGDGIMRRLLAFAEENSLPGSIISLGLMAAKGKEPFYERYGFIARDGVGHGCGMLMRRTAGEG